MGLCYREDTKGQDLQKDEESDTTPEIVQQSASTKRWDQANHFAILTVRKNYEKVILSKFGMKRTAAEVLETLKSLYEGQTVAEYGALLSNITGHHFDNRHGTIVEHIAEYEKR
jgi:hypothetical protein